MNWHHFYNRLSELLVLFYKNNPINTGEKIYKFFIQIPDFEKINPWVTNLNSWNVFSLDPIHIFGSFNYYDISDEKRKYKLELYIKYLEKEFKNFDKQISINNISYINFKGIPSINPTKIMAARKKNTQDEIWTFFYNTMTHKITEIDDFFKLVNNWYGVKVPALTIFLFWANSDRFFPLDKNTIQLMKAHNMLIPTCTAEYVYTILSNRENKKNENSDIFRELAKVAYNERF